MNNCEKYQELISRLVDGELSREEYAALDAHMENCAECSAMYAVFASLSDIIGSEDEALPEQLHENIMAGVRRSAMIKHNKRRLSKPVRNALAAAACAALVLFASRGLAPDKAADTVLSESETVAMDVQVREAAPAAVPEAASAVPAPVQSPVPTAAPAAPVPAATAAAMPREDIYLENDNTEAKPAAGNTNNNSNSVLVTPKPTEIVVYTPSVVNTPAVEQAPSQQVTYTAAPKATEAVQPSVTPTAPAAPAAETSEQPAEAEQPMSVAEAPEAESSNAASPAAVAEEESAAAPAAELEEAAEETEPAATETPSLSKRFFSFFAMPRPAAASDAPEEAEPEEKPAEDPAPSEEPAAPPENAAVEPEAAAQPSPEAEEKKAWIIKLESSDKLEELETLLKGEKAELPKEKADKEYSFSPAEPDEKLEDYELKVFVYGETLYYVQIISEEEELCFVSPCKMEDFEKFMDALSDEEKGIVPELSPAVSPLPAAETSPAVSPALAEGTEQPAQNPEPSPAV